MKILKKRTPELIAGVLFLCFLLAPCAEVCAEEGDPKKPAPASVSVEEMAKMIQATVETAIANQNLPSNEEMAKSIQAAVAAAIANQNLPSNPDMNEFWNKVKKLASKEEFDSANTVAWTALWVSAGLGAACLILLILVLIPLAPMINKKKYEEAQKLKREPEYDQFFNKPLTSILTSIKNINPPTVDEVKTGIDEVLAASVIPALDELKDREIKVPTPEEIAKSVSDKIQSIQSLLNRTEKLLNDTNGVIGKVNGDYGSALDLLKTIRDEQKALAEKKRNLDSWSSKLDGEQKALDEEKKLLHEKETGLAKAIKAVEDRVRQECDTQYEQQKKVLDAKIGELKIKVVSLKQEKNDLETMVGNNKAKIDNLEREKTGLESTVGNLTQAVKERDEQMKSRDEQMKNAQERERVLVREKSTLSTEKENLTKEKQELSSQLGEKDDEIARLEGEKETVSAALASEKALTQTKQSRIDALERKAQDHQTEMDQLQNKFEEADRKKEQYKADYNNLYGKAQELQNEKERLQSDVNAARELNKKAEKIIYPAEFMANPKFAALKQRLDEWIDIPESAMIRAALQLFSQRNTLIMKKREETILNALRDISYGISQTMSSPANKTPAAPDEIITELVKWRDFILGYSDDSFKFNLQIPGLGENYKYNSMTSIKSISQVQKVLSWMVVIPRTNSNPLTKLAEVE